MTETDNMYRAGMVAIVGEPNVGKSTFLNRVLGLKLVITSPKPQTTRDKIAGILSEDDYQIVFLDTPGLVDPRDLLHEALVARVHEALNGVDAVLHLRDAREKSDSEDPTSALLARAEVPVIEVWNKIDLLCEVDCQALCDRLKNETERQAFPISAKDGDGVKDLVATLRNLMPEGPPLYNPDELSDRDMRFLAAEIVREKIFELTEREVPYSVAAQTQEFVERPDSKHYIHIAIYVEHESQKGILIGKGGGLLKQIGQTARPEIEELCQHPVFLELRVKVRKKWTKKPFDLKNFGYSLPKSRKKKR